MNEVTQPNRAQLSWALAGVIPFLANLALIGFALAKQVLVLFAAGWLVLQVFGYVMALKLAKGDTAHYLVKAQVLLNWMALMLLVATLVKVS